MPARADARFGADAAKPPAVAAGAGIRRLAGAAVRQYIGTGAAGERAHKLSGPSCSQAGAVLLNRSPRKPVLTEPGKRRYQHRKRVLETSAGGVSAGEIH